MIVSLERLAHHAEQLAVAVPHPERALGANEAVDIDEAAPAHERLGDAPRGDDDREERPYHPPRAGRSHPNDLAREVRKGGLGDGHRVTTRVCTALRATVASS